MRILIAIPVYNEEKYVCRVLTEVLRHAPQPPHVLVVDDGSTDRTSSMLEKLPVDVIRHCRNRGYGRSLLDAFYWASGEAFEWLITMDCDEQHEPAAIPRFVGEIQKDDADVISGSRYLEESTDRPPPDRRAINTQMTADINARLGLRLTDSFCGFKAYRVAALERLELSEPGYAFPMQFWVQAVAKGLRIREIPVRLIYNDLNRTFGGPLNDPEIRLRHYREVLQRALQRVGLESGRREPGNNGGGGMFDGDARREADGVHQGMSAPLERLKEVRIEPAPAAWRDLVRPWRERATPTQNRGEQDFRQELGLPTDGPVIMAGHEAEFWHPGVVAKYIACQAAAERMDGSVAWVIVDQDAHRADDVRYPIRQPRLGVEVWRALGEVGTLVEHHVPIGAIPATAPAALPDLSSAATPGVRAGMERMHAALSRHTAEPNAARQVTLGVAECLRDVATARSIVFATSLARTSLFRWVVEEMRRDPARCAQTYNEAVRRYPDARVAELTPNAGTDVELPLWRMPAPGQAKARQRATSATLGSAPVESLAPRALLMTALLRLAGCDLFIHGTGGARYDRITAEWMRDWLGVQLAPTVVVTATLTLPLDAEAVTPAEINRAVWRAQRAKHDPALLGDSAAAAEKDKIVAEIRELKRAGTNPAETFARLQMLLTRVRGERGAELKKLAAAASGARAKRREALIAHDRTWAFPLYPPEDLAALKTAIRARFS